MSNDKLRHAILYFLTRTGRALTARELTAMLYLADQEHYRKHLKTITGVQYVAGKYGPEIKA